MIDITWIHKCVASHRERFERLDKMLRKCKYDDEFVRNVREESVWLSKELQVLEKQIPQQKIHEYGGPYKCLRCGCVVNQYAKYCHFCGQRFAVKSATEQEGIEGWCADK